MKILFYGKLAWVLGYTRYIFSTRCKFLTLCKVQHPKQILSPLQSPSPAKSKSAVLSKPRQTTHSLGSLDPGTPFFRASDPGAGVPSPNMGTDHPRWVPIFLPNFNLNGMASESSSHLDLQLDT